MKKFVFYISSNQSILDIVKHIAKHGGLQKLIVYVCVEVIWRIFLENVSRLKKFRINKFTYNQTIHTYNTNDYNRSWSNERTVEVPLVLDFVKQKKSTQIIEVGRVISHYQKVPWLTIDKYESGPNTLSVDVLDYNPSKKIETIISVSTIEHIGFDDDKYNPALGITAINHMKSWLLPGGEMLVTIPIGYNSTLDELLLSNQKIFNTLHFIKRTNIFNDWKQVTVDEVKSVKYGWPYNNANALLIGYYKKP